eukprot:Rmarinus@m.3994
MHSRVGPFDVDLNLAFDRLLAGEFNIQNSFVAPDLQELSSANVPLVEWCVDSLRKHVNHVAKFSTQYLVSISHCVQSERAVHERVSSMWFLLGKYSLFLFNVCDCLEYKISEYQFRATCSLREVVVDLLRVSLRPCLDPSLLIRIFKGLYRMNCYSLHDAISLWPLDQRSKIATLVRIWECNNLDDDSIGIDCEDLGTFSQEICQCMLCKGILQYNYSFVDQAPALMSLSKSSGICTLVESLVAIGGEDLAIRTLEDVLVVDLCNQVQRYACGVFDELVVEKIRKYVCKRVIPFATSFYAALPKDRRLQEMYRTMAVLYQTICGSVSLARIEDMFDIIVEFPDSEPALDDLRWGLSQWSARALMDMFSPQKGDNSLKDLWDIHNPVIHGSETIIAEIAVENAYCQLRTGLARVLVSNVTTAFKKRLLVPAAATSDIVQQYVNTIKAFGHVDETGVWLDAVSAPIREYLRNRGDAIRCIVSALTSSDNKMITSNEEEVKSIDEKLASSVVPTEADAGEPSHLQAGVAPLCPSSGDTVNSGPDLRVELMKNVKVETDFDDDYVDDPDAPSDWAKWEPEPVEARALRPAGTREGDVLSLLVGVYGGQEVFAAEYRRVLASRLLDGVGADVDAEFCTLELLKLRFGDTYLGHCEVMLKDMQDSRRLMLQVRNRLSCSGEVCVDTKSLDRIDSIGLEVAVISKLFWPPVPKETLPLPSVLRNAMEAYAVEYEAVKAPRKLHFLEGVGAADVEVEFPTGESVHFSDVPLALVVILLRFDHTEEHGFEENNEAKRIWELHDLSSVMNSSSAAMRKKLAYWVSKGVLREMRVGHTYEYEFNEGLGGASGLSMPLLSMDDDNDHNAGGHDNVEGDFEAFEMVVLGILMGGASRGVDSIHNLLKMMFDTTSETPYQLTVLDLKSQLDRLVAEGKLEGDNGEYKRKIR